MKEDGQGRFVLNLQLRFAPREVGPNEFESKVRSSCDDVLLGEGGPRCQVIALDRGNRLCKALDVDDRRVRATKQGSASW